MLRLSPDLLGIALAPDSVAWVVMRRGLRRRLLAKGIAKFAAQDSPVWQQALQNLQDELLKLPVTRGTATVVLSNAFARYLLVDGGEVLTAADERLALAKHDFLKVYGAIAQNWEIRIGAADVNGKYLASAVDAELMGQLRRIFSETGFKLDSIQPYFALAFDAWCTGLDDKTSHGIFLSETSGYCYAGIGADAWEFIRCGRWEDGDAVETFQRVTGREACLTGTVQRELWWCPAPDQELARVFSTIKDAQPLPGSEVLRDLAEAEFVPALAGVI